MIWAVYADKNVIVNEKHMPDRNTIINKVETNDVTNNSQSNPHHN